MITIFRYPRGDCEDLTRPKTVNLKVVTTNRGTIIAPGTERFHHGPVYDYAATHRHSPTYYGGDYRAYCSQSVRAKQIPR